MKPITLTPAQLDAALGLPEAGCSRCGWHETFATDEETYSAAAEHRCPPPDVSGGAARAGKTAALPTPILRPRLECTCAQRDYGLCPNCR